MLVVGSEDVHRICAWPALVAALRDAHRGPRPLIARARSKPNCAGSRRPTSTCRPSCPGSRWAPRSRRSCPTIRAAPGMPAVQALYALFDGDDGSPAAVMDGTALTYRKTAADSALGSLLLSREDARVLLMVGAGGLAPYLARAHLAIRPSLARVLVWNRSPARAEELAAAMREEGVDAAAVIDLEAAVRAADIVSCSTAATEPLVAGAWLKPGAHLDLVGGFTPAMRECDDDGGASRTAVHRRGQHQPRCLRRPDRPDPARRDRARQGRRRPLRAVPPGPIARPCARGHHPVQERRRRASRPVHGPVRPRPAARGGRPWVRRSPSCSSP